MGAVGEFARLTIEAANNNNMAANIRINKYASEGEQHVYKCGILGGIK